VNAVLNGTAVAEYKENRARQNNPTKPDRGPMAPAKPTAAATSNAAAKCHPTFPATRPPVNTAAAVTTAAKSLDFRRYA
jgi:hypothetical protein